MFLCWPQIAFVGFRVWARKLVVSCKYREPLVFFSGPGRRASVIRWEERAGQGTILRPYVPAVRHASVASDSPQRNCSELRITLPELVTALLGGGLDFPVFESARATRSASTGKGPGLRPILGLGKSSTVQSEECRRPPSPSSSDCGTQPLRRSAAW